MHQSIAHSGRCRHAWSHGSGQPPRPPRTRSTKPSALETVLGTAGAVLAVATSLSGAPPRDTAGSDPRGVPLFYWGGRPPVIALRPVEGSVEAQVTEVHAAVDREELVLRFSFDRPVRDGLYLSDGTPVSGRLRAVLYVDQDGERSTGLAGGPRDLRTGTERRLEVGVISVGADPDEARLGEAIVTVAVASVEEAGRRRTLWRGDHAATPRRVSYRGEWLEVRLPAETTALGPRLRLVLATGDTAVDGALSR
jgi:hypothetical protein